MNGPAFIYQKLRTQNVFILKMILTRSNIEVKACFHLYSHISIIQLKRPAGYSSLKYMRQRIKYTKKR